MSEMPLFVRTLDFVTWLMPVTNHFPRSQRFLVTQRLLDAALDFQEAIIGANHCRGQERLHRLGHADELLDLVRFYLRLAARWQWLKPGQYQHAAAMVAEMGRLLGGWSGTTRNGTTRIRNTDTRIGCQRDTVLAGAEEHAHADSA